MTYDEWYALVLRAGPNGLAVSPSDMCNDLARALRRRAKRDGLQLSIHFLRGRGASEDVFIVTPCGK